MKTIIIKMSKKTNNITKIKNIINMKLHKIISILHKDKKTFNKVSQGLVKRISKNINKIPLYKMCMITKTLDIINKTIFSLRKIIFLIISISNNKCCLIKAIKYHNKPLLDNNP